MEAYSEKLACETLLKWRAKAKSHGMLKNIYLSSVGRSRFKNFHPINTS